MLDFDSATAERIDRVINKDRPLNRAAKERLAAEQKEAELELRGFFDPARRWEGRDVYPRPPNWVYCRRTKNNWLEKTKILADSYKLFKGQVLGKGHHADVYKGIDMLTGKDLAIKVIYKTVHRRMGMLVKEDPVQEVKNRKLLNEAWFIDYLKDGPGICKMVRVVETATKFYFVMELAQSDLNSYSNGINMREEEIRHILKPIFECLKYAHSHDITHRDIKPENILLRTRKDWLRASNNLQKSRAHGHHQHHHKHHKKNGRRGGLYHLDDGSSIESSTFAHESTNTYHTGQLSVDTTNIHHRHHPHHPHSPQSPASRYSRKSLDYHHPSHPQHTITAKNRRHSQHYPSTSQSRGGGGGGSPRSLNPHHNQYHQHQPQPHSPPSTRPIQKQQQPPSPRNMMEVDTMDSSSTIMHEVRASMDIEGDARTLSTAASSSLNTFSNMTTITRGQSCPEQGDESCCCCDGCCEEGCDADEEDESVQGKVMDLETVAASQGLNFDHRFDAFLADWGLAVEHDCNSGRKPVGTPLYAAPEVVRKMKRIRRREWINYRACDLWSLGVTMFVVASGIYPYHTHDALEAQSPPNWAALEASGMSREYIALTQRLMNLTAELRPSAAEACNDPWLQG